MFKNFADAVRAKFDSMTAGELYVVDVSKEQMWDMYMNSFPAGTNEIYKERREYECNCCKQFINRVGNVVAIVDGKLVSVWDVEVEGYYDIVTKAMAELMKSAKIRTKFLHNERTVGVATNNQLQDDGTVKTWNHFSCSIPKKFFNTDRATVLSGVDSTKHVFERGLVELTAESAEIVLDLILQNSLYKGAEFKDGVASFLKMKQEYSKLITEQEKSIYVWSNVSTAGARIRNTAIGSLLTDISEGVELTKAVASFESKVAPANYKRSSAPISKGMIDNAMKTIAELEIEPSLARRFARIDDISVNNVLFADRSVSPLMKDSLSNLLMSEVKEPKKSYNDVEEISIEDFLANVLPTTTSMEVLMKNTHQSNLMSIIAPQDATSKNILKWGNNFSWGYNGNVTDSMRENVKKAGGNVDGVLRFSIQWNDKKDNNNDLDAHCKEPNGNTINFRNLRSHTSGTLDVDIRVPGDKVAVENIIYTDLNRMPEGDYKFLVNNFSDRGGKNFSAEIEFDGKILSFSYDKKMRTGEDVVVAVVNYSKKNGFTVVKCLPHSESSKLIWGIETEKFQKVSSVMLSPNYWDDNREGNKHYFFILDKCMNPDETRGLYNEFLDNRLNEHRKVFEVLADKMKCPKSTEQLSGVGFSSTVRNELICKVNGSFTRTLKIKF